MVCQCLASQPANVQANCYAKSSTNLSADCSMAQGSVGHERLTGSPHGLQPCDCQQQFTPPEASLNQQLPELPHLGCSLHHNCCPDPGLQACSSLTCKQCMTCPPHIQARSKHKRQNHRGTSHSLFTAVACERSCATEAMKFV